MILILSLFIWILSGIIGAIVYNNNSRLDNGLLKYTVMFIIIITGNIGLFISIFTWIKNYIRIDNEYSKKVLNKIKRKYKRKSS
jgi:uncharacterized membrane protein